MSSFIPLVANFVVVEVSTSSKVCAEEGIIKAERTLSIVLRAHDADIEIVNAGPLSEFDIHLTLMTGISSTQLNPSLGPDDIGYLIQVGDQKGKPFIHGAVAWIGIDLPYFLLQPNRDQMVQLVLPTIPMGSWGVGSFQWHPGKENLLRISSVDAISKDLNIE